MARITSILPICSKQKMANFFISDWLRNRNTLEYIGIWEEINNPNFNYGEFATIKWFL
nr:KilA-N domain-containing protein [Pasteurella canis]